jgi:hypothetical protein
MKMVLTSVLVVAGAVLAACTSGGNEPPPSTPTQSSHTERPKVAPPIDRELDLSANSHEPCDLLSADQRKALGFAADGERGYTDSCSWHTPEADLSVVLFKGLNALQDAYNVLQGVSYNVFRPTSVAGQPAVVYTTFANAPACYITVGVAHDQGFYVTASGKRPNTDWCAMSVTAATDIVHNLGG